MDREELINKEEFPNGKPQTYEFKGGPIRERKCTDIFCLLLFLTYIIGYVIISGVSMNKGDIWKISAQYDAGEHLCGVGEYRDQWQLQLPDPKDQKGVCVTECNTGEYATAEHIECKPNSVITECPTEQTPTKYFMGMCLPKTGGASISVIESIEKAGSNLAATLTTSWDAIVQGLLCALGLSLFFLVVAECIPTVVAWLSVAVFLGAQGTLAWLCLHQSYEDSGTLSSALFWIGIVLVITTVFSVLGVIVSAKNINLAGHTLETAAEFLADHKCACVYPFMSWIVYFAWTVLNVWTQMWFLSSLKVTPTGMLGKEFHMTQTDQWLTFYLVLMFLWGIFFVSTTFLFVQASATAIWYFAESDDILPEHKHEANSVFYISWGRAIVHTGSIAFGALLIALLWIVRIVFEFITNQVERMSKGNNCVKAAMCLCRCVVWVTTGFLIQLTDAAFLHMGIEGTHFLRSCAEASDLKKRHMGGFAVLAMVGGCFEWIGILFVVSLTGVCEWQILSSPNWEHYQKGNESHKTLPICIALFGAFVISKTFMNLYSTVADAILYYYHLDKEMHNFPKNAKKYMKDHVTKHTQIIDGKIEDNAEIKQQIIDKNKE